MKLPVSKSEAIKYLLIVPLFIFIVYYLFSSKSNPYLNIIVVLAIAAVVIYDFMLFKRGKSTGGDISHIYLMEIEELKRKLETQQQEIQLMYKQSIPINTELMSSIDRLVKTQSELEMKNEELGALRDASEVITSTFNVKTMVEYIYKVLNKFTGCDRYFICFAEKEIEELICKYEFGTYTFGEVGSVYKDDTSIKKCFHDREPVIKTNVMIEKRGQYGDKMSIPLNASGELVGVIFIESGVPGSFSQINVSFLESLANLAAVAIKNAELFNNVYSQKQEIEALYEQASAVNEQLNAYITELNHTKEELKLKNDELTNYYDDIQTGYFQTVMALANSIEAKDAYTRGHCQRVMEIACEIGNALGYGEDEIEDLRYAAILHDIGKIGISASILNKQEKLTDEEYDEIKKHPLISHSILKDVEFIRGGLEAILQHHERYDGKGYPNGLKGDEICKFGKILCVADAFDAMTSDRPYRKGMPMEAAVKEIERCKGSQFDPEIAELFINMSKQIIDAGISL